MSSSRKSEQTCPALTCASTWLQSTPMGHVTAALVVQAFGPSRDARMDSSGTLLPWRWAMCHIACVSPGVMRAASSRMMSDCSARRAEVDSRRSAANDAEAK